MHYVTELLPSPQKTSLIGCAAPPLIAQDPPHHFSDVGLLVIRDILPHPILWRPRHKWVPACPTPGGAWRDIGVGFGSARYYFVTGPFPSLQKTSLMGCAAPLLIGQNPPHHLSNVGLPVICDNYGKWDHVVGIELGKREWNKVIVVYVVKLIILIDFFLLIMSWYGKFLCGKWDAIHLNWFLLGHINLAIFSFSFPLCTKKPSKFLVVYENSTKWALVTRNGKESIFRFSVFNQSLVPLIQYKPWLSISLKNIWGIQDEVIHLLP